MAKHKIIGPRAIDGVQPGGMVELDHDRARLLARAGHIAWPKAKRRSSTDDGSAPRKKPAQDLDDEIPF